MLVDAHLVILIFQSTLSMRRATDEMLETTNSPVFQSTLSMRRATSCEIHPTELGK